MALKSVRSVPKWKEVLGFDDGAFDRSMPMSAPSSSPPYFHENPESFNRPTSKMNWQPSEDPESLTPTPILMAARYEFSDAPESLTPTPIWMKSKLEPSDGMEVVMEPTAMDSWPASSAPSTGEPELEDTDDADSMHVMAKPGIRFPRDITFSRNSRNDIYLSPSCPIFSPGDPKFLPVPEPLFYISVHNNMTPQPAPGTFGAEPVPNIPDVALHSSSSSKSPLLSFAVFHNTLALITDITLLPPPTNTFAVYPSNAIEMPPTPPPSSQSSPVSTLSDLASQAPVTPISCRNSPPSDSPHFIKPPRPLYTLPGMSRSSSFLTRNRSRRATTSTAEVPVTSSTVSAPMANNTSLSFGVRSLGYKTERLIPTNNVFSSERYAFFHTLPRTCVKEKFEWRVCSSLEGVRGLNLRGGRNRVGVGLDPWVGKGGFAGGLWDPMRRELEKRMNPKGAKERKEVEKGLKMKLVRWSTGDVVGVFAGMGIEEMVIDDKTGREKIPRHRRKARAAGEEERRTIGMFRFLPLPGAEEGGVAGTTLGDEFEVLAVMSLLSVVERGRRLWGVVERLGVMG